METLPDSKKNWFQRHPRKTSFFLFVTSLLILCILVEYILQTFMGLGTPVIYQANPFYGYRPAPNQEITRFRNAKIKINNLGLRANKDWDNNVKGKVLFLGDSVTYGGSYIDNTQLFSNLAVEDIEDYKSGNAGVNGWGVEAIYGLVVESDFIPAEIYVTVLIEGDFYRQLSGIRGLPFWCRKPSFAIEELFFHYLTLFNNNRYQSWDSFYGDEKIVHQLIEKSVIKLKQMDAYLKSKGFVHLIYISPEALHLFHNKEKDQTVLQYLTKHQLNVTYLVDRLKLLDLPEDTAEQIYYDGGHLDVAGHQLWGKLINEDLKQIVLEK